MRVSGGPQEGRTAVQVDVIVSVGDRGEDGGFVGGGAGSSEPQRDVAVRREHDAVKRLAHACREHGRLRLPCSHRVWRGRGRAEAEMSGGRDARLPCMRATAAQAGEWCGGSRSPPAFTQNPIVIHSQERGGDRSHAWEQKGRRRMCYTAHACYTVHACSAVQRRGIVLCVGMWQWSDS